MTSAAPRSDASLALAVARSDESAMSEIYTAHHGSVRALATRLLRDHALADEVSQEIFIRLWNRPERYDPDRGTLRSFLLADTHGRSIDLLRSEQARKRREERESRLETKPRYDLEREVWSRVATDHIQEALAGLSDGERRAIELAYFEGHPYRKVAEILGEPEGTVKSRIRVGLKRLKATLGPAGIVPS